MLNKLNKHLDAKADSSVAALTDSESSLKWATASFHSFTLDFWLIEIIAVHFHILREELRFKIVPN